MTEIPATAQVSPKAPPLFLPLDEPHAQVETITPADAAAMLTRHAHNRPIKDRTVAAYARDMARGRWPLTGEAIKFDTNGDLVDGRHRLKAIIAAGVAVRILVVYGVPPEAQAVMDSGVKRSVNDQLAMKGVKNRLILTAAARLALTEPGAGFIAAADRITNPTHTELMTWIEEHPGVHRAAETGRSYYPAIDVQPSVLCVAWMRLSAIDMDACSMFFHTVANMNTDGPGDPRLALARRLQNLRRDGARRNSSMLLGLVYRSWNAWRRGKQLNSLPVNASIPEKLW
jgi:hypothetical protein